MPTVLRRRGYRFHFCKRATGNVLVGYRALYQDYSDDDFTYDATMHGLIFGIDVGF